MKKLQKWSILKSFEVFGYLKDQNDDPEAGADSELQ